MRLGWIVLAHHRPAQLARLIDRLHQPGDVILLHVDADVALAPFQEALAGRPEPALLPRHHSRWGTYGVMQATLEGMAEALRAGADYISVISGQDYPIKPVHELRAHLEAEAGTSFMTYWPLPTPHWPAPDRGLARVELRYYRLGRLQFHLPNRFTPFIPRRRMPMGLTPYAGANWWSLPRRAVEYVLGFRERHPEVERFYRHSAFPAEGMVQTILLNSPLRETAVYGNLRHIVWPPGATHPETLDVSHLEELAASRAFLARKIDAERDPELLDLIDERLLGIAARGPSGSPEPA